MKIDPDDLLTVSEAATLRGVSHQAISYLARNRRVKTVSIRGRTYILLKDLEDYRPGKPGPRPKEKVKKPRQEDRKKLT
jgi:Zn-dependent peptidase ImmA (M78 family)